VFPGSSTAENFTTDYYFENSTASNPSSGCDNHGHIQHDLVFGFLLQSNPIFPAR
jgi:hypothetical protein